MELSNKKIVENFLEALSNGVSGEGLNQFYHNDVLQIEYPNLLTKNLTENDLEKIKEGSVKGAQILKSQSYELVNLYEMDNVVIIEAIWRGTLNIPVGKLNPGDEMKAYFAQFYEFKDGLIYRQRNYDCFETFI
ncbi:MAG: nuclear transport factor 2 family protein [Clostridia bacterium]|nr:nuclear transport factor 2 family protein [Clostridia bacterium]